jgi:hypothetical protein
MWQVRENEKWRVASWVFVVDESGATCGCGKLKTCGIPCSHLYVVLKRKNQFPNLSGMIARRWLIDEGQRREARLQIASEVKAPKFPPALLDHGLHSKQRYAALMGETATVASHGCRSHEAFEDFREVRARFSERILRPEWDQDGAVVVELAGARPAQMARHRIRAEVRALAADSTCTIASRVHQPAKYPQRNVAGFLCEPDDQRKGDERRCPVCELRRHLMARCLALHRYRAKNHGAGPEEDGEGRNLIVGESGVTSDAIRIE